VPIRRADRLFDILRILRSAKAPVTAASIADEAAANGLGLALTTHELVETYLTTGRLATFRRKNNCFLRRKVASARF